jgi:RimJ/RimL family protein N-acetyltransferase
MSGGRVINHAREHEIMGERVRLRSWQRRDTLAHELWPRYTEPFNSLWNIPRAFGFDDISYGGWNAQRFVWAVDDRSGRLIGRISLREVQPDRSSARLGISIAQPYVSQGLGTEALRLFIDYYFTALDFAALRLDVAAFNLRAVRCYERLGFQYVESEWRSAGSDPALRLLDDPRYSDLVPFFRRGRYETHVEFYEMILPRDVWLGRG